MEERSLLGGQPRSWRRRTALLALSGFAAALASRTRAAGLRRRSADAAELAFGDHGDKSWSFQSIGAHEVAYLLTSANDTKITCDRSVSYAFCGEATCTRLGLSDDPGSDIAACACREISEADDEPAYIFLGWAGLLFASSDTYIKLVHDYVTGAADIDEITDRACDALSQNTFYPEVAPDLTSQPANGVLSSELKSRVVVNKTCEAPLTTSLCSNAPCFYTPDFGELNYTCWCPVMPEPVLHNQGNPVELIAPSVGHFGQQKKDNSDVGACADYAFGVGTCTVQGNQGSLGPFFQGSHELTWAVAAYATMKNGERPGDMRDLKCRAWVGSELA